MIVADKGCPESEQWLPIPGCEGFQISHLANVRNRYGRIMKQRFAANGGFRIDIAGKTYSVAKLHTQVFGEPPRPERKCSKGHVVKDEDKWGVRNHICRDCLDGKPRVRQLPDVI